jgi:hypothetical protein
VGRSYQRKDASQKSEESTWAREKKAMMGLGKKKLASTEAPSLDSTPMASWMSGEAPSPKPKKKQKVDSGGILTRGSMKLA